MVDVRIKNIEESDADTVISEDMVFEGNIKLSRPAMIKGQVSGKINSESNIFIEKGASVKAELKADELSVKGNLDGVIDAVVAELGNTSTFKGDIRARSLAMESGCVFSGTSRIGVPEPVAEPASEEDSEKA